MSDFHVVVVEIGKVGKHPNGDNLSITQVMGGYPCIFRTGEFNEGDKAVYISVDALVPLDDPRWAFLKAPDSVKTHERIKAKRLRGIFSMGILTKADSSWSIGQDVRNELKINKWEPPIERESLGGLNVHCGLDIPVYDIEGLRKYKNVLTEGEEVICTEKLHGTNSRWFADKEGKLWVGSRNYFKKEDPDNLWWKVAAKYNLAEKLVKYPEMVFYGEVFGQVQDLTYNAAQGEVMLRMFDVFDLQSRRWLNYDDCVKLVTSLDLEMVPVLYRGPWSESVMDLAEGKSTFTDSHMREGFVVKPTKERWDERLGRVILKMVGQGYLLRKQK